MRALLLVLASCPLLAVGGAAPLLTSETFDAEVFNSGKNAFVKFFAPWCGHCKSMKPAWDEIAEEHAGSKVLVADVDCTADDAKDLCEKYEVEGFPTVKYFTSSTGDKGEDYDGGRGAEQLRAFIREELAPRCQVADLKDCTEKETGFIAKMKAKGGADVAKAELTRLQGMVTNKMAPDLKKWLKQRIDILTQMVEA